VRRHVGSPLRRDQPAYSLVVLGTSLLTSWTLAPLQLAPIALVATAYGVRARGLARRGQPVPGWRIALFALGIALLLVAVASPIAAVAEDELFSFHMIQHLLLGDLAPLCILAGLTGPLLRPLLALPGVLRLKVFANPFVALPVWSINLALWHLPALYETSVTNGAVHAVQHIAFFSAGIVLWLPVLETLPAPEWFGTGWKLSYVVGVRLVGTLLGNVFVWSGEPFYDVYETGRDYLGLTPEADQSLAGSIMMLEGSLVTVVAIAWLFLRMAQESEARQRLLERGVDERTARRAVRYRRWSELPEPPSDSSARGTPS
jgi:putative membrane protein